MNTFFEPYKSFKTAEMEFEQAARVVLDGSINGEPGRAEALARWVIAAENLEAATAAIATAIKRVQ